MSDHNAYQLARLADVASPDELDSAGARFLLGVQDTVTDYLRYADDPGQGIEDIGGAIHEIADSAVPVYTHERWTAFVDLAAYQEDVSEYGDYSNDLTRAAGVALYMIAERLAVALRDEASEEDEEE